MMKATSMSPRSGQRTASGNAVVFLHGHQLERNLARAVTAEAAGTFGQRRGRQPRPGDRADDPGRPVHRLWAYLAARWPGCGSCRSLRQVPACRQHARLAITPADDDLSRTAERPDDHCPRPGLAQLAACRHADPELFFPVSASGPSLDQVTQAKAICAGCPVRQQCLAFALDTRQDHGVWGGMSDQERRPRARKPCNRT
jgi:WhiB family redox-sensing transcriptional regulator